MEGLESVSRKHITAPRAGAVRLASDERLAILAKALGHPARIEILRMLRERHSCIGCDIADEVGLAQSTTSEHLRILKEAGIIVGEIERPRVCYSLNPESLVPLARLLNAVFEKDSVESSAARSAARRQAAKSPNHSID